MSIWGKLVGVTAGMLIGGPLGAFVGAVGGHYMYDREPSEESLKEKKQLTFTIGVIALGAKMAKADGVVTTDEIKAFKEVFIIPEDQVANVARVFDLAKQDVAGYESYARQLSEAFADEPKLLEDVLEGLFHIAEADNVIHQRELGFLSNIAQIFGFTEDEFSRISARHITPAEDDPYLILGIEKDASSAEIKRAYFKLVKENHPDQLMARGVPEEFIEVANRKLAKINTAYDLLTKKS